MQETAVPRPAPVHLRRWPSEIPLLVFVVLASAGIWLLLAVSIVGLLYAVVLAVFFFFAHLLFVTHIRGSAVRLGPSQFPELHRRLVELAGRAGLDPVPAAYLMESGGALNALASRFLRSRFIVLYSDLLDACEDDEAARDMVIGHELGHVKAGHLDWMWFLFPGMFVPFLGSAYSRARELTCDRYGAALCGDRAGALHGLAILAAGGNHAGRVDLETFAAQTRDLDTGWMTLGKWLSRYPPLCERISALEPSLKPEGFFAVSGPVRAVLILAAILFLPMVGIGVVMAGLGSAFQSALGELGTALDSESSSEYDDTWAEDESYGNLSEEEIGAARERFDLDFERFQAMLDEWDARGLAGPQDLYGAWSAIHPGEAAPEDPFDGLPYGYDVSGDGRRLWSSGPDGEGGTDDDIERYFSTASATPLRPAENPPG